MSRGAKGNHLIMTTSERVRLEDASAHSKVTNQLLIGKSKPKVKIRREQEDETLSSAKFEKTNLSGAMIISSSRGSGMMPLVLAMGMLMTMMIVTCRSSPLMDRRHSHRSMRATDDSATNVTSELSPRHIVAVKAAPTTATTTTSELSFEFLNLKSIPSVQLCQIEGREQVNSVSFADNQIKSIQSSAFVCISFRLKILDLRNNKIETISDEALKGLTHLQVLILESNRLVQVPVSQVGSSYLPSLRHLNLANNHIQEVRASSDTTVQLSATLISLSLKGNPITSIHPKSFANLSKLKTLTLSQLDFHAEHLAHFEGELNELRFLHLDRFGANLSSLEESFCESSRKLASLSLKANQLKRVPQFTNCHSLISLDLSYNQIQGTLDGNFSRQNNLIDLYLGHNQLEHLSERALLGLDRLQVLELAANKLKTIHSNAFVPVRTSLYELNIANNARLSALPAAGLDGLIILKAYGNNQLRKLPTHFPAAKLLALTYAYHCCDYYKSNYDEEEEDDDDDGHDATRSSQRRRNPSLFASQSSYTTGEEQNVRSQNDGAMDPFQLERVIREDNKRSSSGVEKDENSSLLLQLSNLISSKLSRLWGTSRRSHSPTGREPETSGDDDGGDKDEAQNWLARTGGVGTQQQQQQDSSSRNISEFVLWPAPTRGKRADDENLPASSSSSRSGNDLAGKSQLEQVVTQAPRMEVAVRRPLDYDARVMIDELVWQLERIRFTRNVRDDKAHEGAQATTSSVSSDHANVWPPMWGRALADEENSRDLDRGEPETDEAYLVARALTARRRRASEHQLVKRRRRSAQERELTEAAASLQESASAAPSGERARHKSHAHNSGVQCLPRPDSFQPCRDLFDSIWLRASVWLVFLFAFLGNICVIVVLGSVRPSSSASALTSIMWFNAAHSKRHIDVPRFLVLNLALADLLMACYLGILAFVDLSTLGEFRLHAIKWQHSTGCKLAGFLAVLSSELSVFILAIITLERNYAITNAVHLNRRLSLQKAMVIMFFGYVYALAMALMPLNGINDYRKYSICLPLNFEPTAPLLESSSNLYLLMLISINTLSFVLLLSCYLRMYCAIRGSQAWNTNDLKIAKRMSILVVTDFLCWSPIICVALATLFGRYLVGAEGLKLLIIFVLPLNSVANPFLYAITTKKFKRDLAILKKRLRLDRVARVLSLITSYLTCACCRATTRDKLKHGGPAGVRLPAGFSTMDQVYCRRSAGKHKLEKVAKGKRIMLGALQVASASEHRVKSKMGKQELLVAAQSDNQNPAIASSRLVNQRHFQSFERNDKPPPGARTHCPSCQRKLAAVSAFEPSSLIVATRIAPQDMDNDQEVQMGQHEMEQQSHLFEKRKPKIVLDAVEPVVGVAMAPLRLADRQLTSTGGIGGGALSAPIASAVHTSSQSPAPSSLEPGERRMLSVSDTISQRQLQASSGDQQQQQQQQQQQRASSADNPAKSRASPHFSCQTVLVSDRLARSMLAPMMSDEQAEANRSASACAFVWPTQSTNSSLGSKKVSKLSPPDGGTMAQNTTATCCSCSCEMIQVRPSRKALSHQSSNCFGATTTRETRATDAARLTASGANRHESRGARIAARDGQRASSINRLVFEPLARAWSNLQISLQSGHLGGSQAATQAHTHNYNPNGVSTNNNAFNRRQAAAAAAAATSPAAGTGNGDRGRASSPASVDSCERDQLLLLNDEQDESLIIEDILLMSSPARRRLLSGRRMSRSCDVIIEQSSTTTTSASNFHRLSTTSGAGEPTTSSSFYDQNDDQRILLATINQLSARRRNKKNRARRRARVDQANDRATFGHVGRRLTNVTGAQDKSDNNNNQQIGTSTSRRRAACTRCRSWSPALLDKLEDCMLQIRSRIPRFNAKELQRDASFEPMESRQSTSTTTSNDGQQHEIPGASQHTRTRVGGAQEEEGERDKDEITSTSETASLSSPSSSSSAGAIIEGEEDEFNEVGLADWTRNMQKKAPVNCYAKSASRHRLRQQLSANSDTLSGRTIGTTLTSVSFDSNSNIPAIISSSFGGSEEAGAQRQSEDESAQVEPRRVSDKRSDSTKHTLNLLDDSDD